MKLAFFSVVLNIHQLYLADELYKLLGSGFVYIELQKGEGANNKGGHIDCYRPYLFQPWKGLNDYNMALELTRTADVAIFGAESLLFEIERMKLGKLSFEVSERWLKRGWLNILSPRLLKNMWYYHTLFHNKPIYKLCASAYCANDQYKLHSYEDKCYKWGYFTKVEDFDVQAHVDSKPDTPVSLMWCARFLDWKHPELVVKLARKLKDNSYSLIIDMFGSGVELEKTKKLCQRMDVEDMIKFNGNKPNDEILAEMRKHDIFLFTSDRNEGWGAVLNEAMSNGCTVVASNEIGAVPFLVKDGENGLVFKSKSVDSLYDNVVRLIEHPNERKQMAINAYHTMKYGWSPEVAARNLLALIDDLQHGKENSIKEGVCSKTFPSINVL